MTEQNPTTVPTPEGASPPPEEARAASDRWEQCADHVVRSLPRLRTIASHAALIAPVVMPITTNGWGGGYGC